MMLAVMFQLRHST